MYLSMDGRIRLWTGTASKGFISVVHQGGKTVKGYTCL